MNLTKQERNMRKRFTSIITVLVVALMALFVSCEQNTTEPLASSISVQVADETGARTITPSGNVNISHYVITIVNEAEGMEQKSDYLPKGSMFTVSNVPAGTWYAKVDAYVQNNGSYIKITSAQSEPKAVGAGSIATFYVVLETLDEVLSGDVTITLKMPTELAIESTQFWYTYTITELTDTEPFTYTSTLAQSATEADGLATITIDADTINLMQGAYRFEITVQNAETSPTLTRKGVDVMRLINGLSARGTVDLNSDADDLYYFNMIITDNIGDILTPEIKDGQEVYYIYDDKLTVSVDNPAGENLEFEWYVDGELYEFSGSDFTFTFTSGNHIVNAIVRNKDTLMAVGSIPAFKVCLTSPDYAGDSFIFYEDSSSVTLRGLSQPIGQFKMPTNGVLELPSIFHGKPVTAISSDAFKGRTDIVGSVVIPDSITKIGQNAFANCASLESINIPEGVTKLENGTFTDCISLSTITLPSTLKDIGDLSGHHGPFKNCTALQSISIPTNVTTIGYYAFLNCSSLKSINIPDGVTEIGRSAFQGCSALTSINIPDGVTEIGDYAFQNCSALETVNISDSSQLTSIGSDAFKNCSALTSVNIPDGVTSIGWDAFQDCSSLTSITIPDGVTSIGWYTFQDCSSLTSINIPDSVTSIGRQAFYGCSALKTVNISDSSQLTSIGYAAFEGCSALQSINIPDSVTSIGNDAFYSCSALETVNIYDTSQLTSIGDGAFENCSALQSIMIPEGVISIEVATFRNCTSLSEVVLPSTLKELKGADIIEDGGWVYVGGFTNCSSLKTINIPDGVIIIGDCTFKGCSALETVNISDSSQLASIEYAAFYGCSALTSINIPDGVTTIEQSAFQDCSALTSITIPGGVTSIGGSAFKGCSALTSIDISDGVTSIEYSAFSECSALVSIKLPSSLKSIKGGAFYNCTNLQGPLVIPDGFESFPGGSSFGAFEDCTSLTSVTIPESIVLIDDDRLFSGCSGLQGVINIPASCELKDYSFYGCSNLEVYHGDTKIWPTN